MGFFSKNKPDTSSALVATAAGVKAKDVYVDLLAGLKKQVADLRRDKLFLQLIALVAVVGIVVLLPLHKRVPYFYEVDSSTGRVALTNKVANELKVSDSNISYFLRVWTARMVTINSGTLREGLPSAYKWTRGSASRELDDWTVNEDKTAERIARSPGLSRNILGSPTVSFNEERNIAFIDFVWIEKIDGVETKRQRKVLTLEFGLAPAKRSEQEPEDPDNPLGIAITHITLNDLVSSK
jgi:type IV secretory pathway component VirB8